jgi:hypothetical protein
MSSIRFEKLIEGIQDFEKIHILQEEFEQSGNQAKTEELNQILNAFDLKMLKEVSSEKTINEAKAILDKY